MFVHCDLGQKEVTRGHWSEWTQATRDLGMCDFSDPSGRHNDFDQWQRTCQGPTGSNEVNFCPGNWLSLTACPKCGAELDINENYNDQYTSSDSSSKSNYDYGTYTYDTEDNTSSYLTNPSYGADEGIGRDIFLSQFYQVRIF